MHGSACDSALVQDLGEEAAAADAARADHRDEHRAPLRDDRLERLREPLHLARPPDEAGVEAEEIGSRARSARELHHTEARRAVALRLDLEEPGHLPERGLSDQHRAGRGGLLELRGRLQGLAGGVDRGAPRGRAAHEQPPRADAARNLGRERGGSWTGSDAASSDASSSPARTARSASLSLARARRTAR